MSGRLRYGRRLVVVAAVVAAIVGLGFLWKHSPAASLVADDRSGGDRVARAGARPRDEGFRGNDHSGMSLSNIDELVQTVVIGVGILGAVVVVDRVRRTRKPIRPVRP